MIGESIRELHETNAADESIKSYENVLSKLAWSVPIVQPNAVRKVNLYKSIAANNVIPVSFRMRQCERFSLPQLYIHCMAMRC